MQENDIIAFQISRQVRNLGKLSLNLLENAHVYIKTLEKLLLDMGIEKYKESNYEYLKDRKAVLDRVGDAERELISLIKSFEIKLKRE